MQPAVRLPIAVVIASIGLWLWAAPASAQPAVPKAFETAYLDGQEAYNLGDYATARARFDRARQLAPKIPGPYRWLAVVALAQKRYEDCLEEATGYLRLSPNGKYVGDVRKLHRQCRAKLDRSDIDGEIESGSGGIAITCNINGAILRLNGLKYGATPIAPRPVAAGTVRIDVDHESYLGKTTTVEVVAGIVTDVHLELEPDPNAKTDEEEPKPKEEVKVGWVIFSVGTPDATITFNGSDYEVRPGLRIEADPGLHEVIITATDHEPWRRRVRVSRGQKRLVTADLKLTALRHTEQRRGHMLLGAAAALAATGAVFSHLHGDALEEAQDLWDIETTRPAPPNTMEDVIPVRTREELSDVSDRGKRYGLISNLSYGLAAIAFGACIYYYSQERPQEREGFELPIALVPITDADDPRVVGMGATFRGELSW